MEDMRNTTELLGALYTPGLYEWHGSYYYSLEAPVGGDSVSMGRLELCRTETPTDGEAPRYVEIPHTFWSDYSGDAVNRSNGRAIREEYGQYVVHVTGDFGTEGLVLPLGVEIPEDMYHRIVSLQQDYPLWDDEDHSNLEREIEVEDWESYGRHDLVYRVRELARVEDQDDDVDELDEHDQVDAIVNDTDLRWDWECETAVSGYYTNKDKMAEFVWQYVKTRRAAALIYA
jgi:hypothetical protein